MATVYLCSNVLVCFQSVFLEYFYSFVLFLKGSSEFKTSVCSVKGVKYCYTPLKLQDRY